MAGPCHCANETMTFTGHGQFLCVNELVSFASHG